MSYNFKEFFSHAELCLLPQVMVRVGVRPERAGGESVFQEKSKTIFNKITFDDRTLFFLIYIIPDNCVLLRF